MFCSHCGKQIKDESQFCEYCGQQVDENAKPGNGFRSIGQDRLTELYNENYNDVYRSIYYIVKNEDAAQDILQDTFLKAFERIEQLENPDSFTPWVKQIGINNAKNYLKKNKPILFTELNKEAAEDDTPVEETFRDERQDILPEVVLDKKETARLIMEILGALPDEQRIVVSMFYYDEFSVRQIAEELGLTESAVKSRLAYGRNKIEKEVLALEKRGTKLYGLTPVPFLLLLLRGMDAQAAEQPDGAALRSILRKLGINGSTAVQTAGASASPTGTISTAASAGASSAAATGTAAAGSALVLKIAAVVLVVAVSIVGGYAIQGRQADHATQEETDNRHDDSNTETKIQEINTELSMTDRARHIIMDFFYGDIMFAPPIEAVLMFEKQDSFPRFIKAVGSGRITNYDIGTTVDSMDHANNMYDYMESSVAGYALFMSVTDYEAEYVYNSKNDIVESYVMGHEPQLAISREELATKMREEEKVPRGARFLKVGRFKDYYTVENVQEIDNIIAVGNVLEFFDLLRYPNNEETPLSPYILTEYNPAEKVLRMKRMPYPFSRIGESEQYKTHWQYEEVDPLTRSSIGIQFDDNSDVIMIWTHNIVAIYDYDEKGRLASVTNYHNSIDYASQTPETDWVKERVLIDSNLESKRVFTYDENDRISSVRMYVGDDKRSVYTNIQHSYEYHYQDGKLIKITQNEPYYGGYDERGRDEPIAVRLEENIIELYNEFIY